MAGGDNDNDDNNADDTDRYFMIITTHFDLMK